MLAASVPCSGAAHRELDEAIERVQHIKSVAEIVVGVVPVQASHLRRRRTQQQANRGLWRERGRRGAAAGRAKPESRAKSGPTDKVSLQVRTFAMKFRAQAAEQKRFWITPSRSKMTNAAALSSSGVHSNTSRCHVSSSASTAALASSGEAAGVSRWAES